MWTISEAPFLVRLFDEIDGIDPEAFPPNHKVDSGEKVIGTAAPYEKRLFAIERMCSKECDTLKVEAKYHSADEGCDAFNAKIDEMEDKVQIVNQMMWSCIKDRLNLWGKQKVHGLRIGWTIVEFDPPEHQHLLPPHIRKIIGLE
jgi:hypothetical protein